MDKHGRAKVLHNAVEIGQGTYQVLHRVAVEALGIRPDEVTVPPPDTLAAPFYYGTSSSRNTVAMGMAVQRAAEDLQRDLLELAAKVKGGDPREWRMEGGQLWRGDQAFDRGEIIQALTAAPTVMGKGSYSTRLSEAPWGCENPYWEVAVGAAEVEVDPDTGETQLLKYATLADVGHAINRQACQAQLDGGAVQGLGHTLYEEVIYQDGQMLTGAASQYRVPLLHDLPEEFVSEMVEHGDGPGPYGSKGAGQGTISPIAPAIGNAIFAATGVRVHDLPITSEKVARALGQLNG
jgi:CO/xanthine dehydrogenase Mo-binding subunit